MKNIKRILFSLIGTIGLIAGLFVGAGTASAAPTVPVGPGTAWAPNPGAVTFAEGCTITAVGRDAANRLVAITAGHCTQQLAVGSPVYRLGNSGPGPIGWVTANRHAQTATSPITPPSKTELDYGVLHLNEAVVIPRLTSEDGQLTTSTVGDASLFQIGCKNGNATGQTCGLIISQGSIFYKSYAAAAPGDSGAPFVVGTKLVGMLIGIDPTVFPPNFQYNKITPTLNAINANGGIGAGFRLST